VSGNDDGDKHNTRSSTGEDVDTSATTNRATRVELGVNLLACIEDEELSLSDAVDRIETVTTDPSLTREILDTAVMHDVIDREDGRLRTQDGATAVRFDKQIIKRDGDYKCRRCGSDLSTGHFLQVPAGELGPFGPSCVRIVLGRES
jgi:hypothetical protein